MRRRLDGQNCALARTLDVLTDPWTFLILQEAFAGVQRFSDFEAALDISKNILSARLARLVESGILEQLDCGRYGRRLEYRLTAKGQDLAVVLAALRQWGDRWIFGEGNEPVVFCDRFSGQPLAPLALEAACGRAVKGEDMMMRPGPGASPETVAKLEARAGTKK